MTHTPAPWHVATQTFSRDGRALSGEVPVIRMHGACDAIICGMGASKEEQNANAHLIAAAPELLDALVELREEARRLGVHEKWQKADAAIARAKGQQ
jgi:hypothetical protein